MITGGLFRILSVAALASLAGMPDTADAAQCGSTATDFEAWKRQLADEARQSGVSAATVTAFTATTYSRGTIAAEDRKSVV